MFHDEKVRFIETPAGKQLKQSAYSNALFHTSVSDFVESDLLFDGRFYGLNSDIFVSSRLPAP